MSIQGFLTDAEEQAVVDAITAAEKRTSGEIRIHIENRCKGDVVERAKRVFTQLNMYKTKERNAVLIYIALLEHKLVIWGDEGIHSKVGQQFWDQEVRAVIEAFKERKFVQGLVSLIQAIGEKLATLFPFKENDVDELDNSISKNNN